MKTFYDTPFILTNQPVGPPEKCPKNEKSHHRAIGCVHETHCHLDNMSSECAHQESKHYCSYTINQHCNIENNYSELNRMTTKLSLSLLLTAVIPGQFCSEANVLS